MYSTYSNHPVEVLLLLPIKKKKSESQKVKALLLWSERMAFLWCATAALRGKSCSGQALETKKPSIIVVLNRSLFLLILWHTENQKPPYQSKRSTTYFGAN